MLLRNHVLRGCFAEMADVGFPAEVVEAIRDSIDCNLYFFGNPVEIPVMYGILAGAVAVLTLGYCILCGLRRKKG